MTKTCKKRRTKWLQDTIIQTREIPRKPTSQTSLTSQTTCLCTLAALVLMTKKIDLLQKVLKSNTLQEKERPEKIHVIYL